MARKKNRNDVLLESISALNSEILWDDYEHKNAFSYLCKVTPERAKERLVIIDQVEEDIQRPCTYILVIEGRIFKIGKAEALKRKTGFAGRITSYNCGTRKNRESGTCSTTNYWVLQSLIKLNKEILVYGFYPDFRSDKVFGESIAQPFPTPKIVEEVVIKQFEQKYGKKPIGCTQG